MSNYHVGVEEEVFAAQQPWLESQFSVVSGEVWCIHLRFCASVVPSVERAHPSCLHHVMAVTFRRDGTGQVLRRVGSGEQVLNKKI